MSTWYRKFIFLVIFTKAPLAFSLESQNNGIYLISPQKYDLSQFDYAASNEKFFPHLSTDDTLQLSYTFKGILSSLYVNKDYIDITPQLKYEVKQLTQTDLYQNKKAFMMSAVHTFQQLNDLHSGLNYGFPFNCFLSGFPLKTQPVYNQTTHQYDFVISEKGNLQALIQAIRNKQFADKNSENYYANLNLYDIENQFEKIQVGDKLISISNLAVQSNDPNNQLNILPNAVSYFNDHLNDENSVIHQLSEFSRAHKTNWGANLIRSNNLIFSRFGGAMQIPGSGNLPSNFELKTERGTYHFPWLSVLTNDPLNDANQQCQAFLDTSYLNVTSTPQVYVGDLEEPNYPTETFLNALPSEQDFKETKTIETRLLKRNGKQYAYVRIKEFLPDSIIDLDYHRARIQILQSVQTIKNFLMTNKENTVGIIFDIRNNPGGYGSYASALGKLFKTKSPYEDFLIYPINSSANKEMYNNLFQKISNIVPNLSNNDRTNINHIFINIFEGFSDSLSHPEQKEYTTEGDKLSILNSNFDSDPNDSLKLILDSIEQNQELQPFKNLFSNDDLFYDGDGKHVAVLINGASFSSSDIFTSIFKSYNIAKIYGQDTSASGGGGANVIFYNQFQTVDNSTSIIPFFDDKGLVPGKTAPILPNDMFLSFAWNRVVGMKCLDHADCQAPENPDDFVEKYYFPDTQQVVNGVPVDTILHTSLKDIQTKQKEKQPIFEKIMDDLDQNY